VTFIPRFGIPRITDDAGLTRELFNPIRPPADPDPGVLEIALRIQEEHGRPRPGGWFAEARPSDAARGTFVSPAMLVSVLLFGSSPHPLALAAIYLPFIGLESFAWHRLARNECADATRDTLLGEGRCPCCAYTIGDLDPGPDGLIRCPECEAAWNRARVGLPAPPAAASPDPIPFLHSRRLDLMPTVPDKKGRLVRLTDLRALARADPSLAPIDLAVRSATVTRRAVTAAFFFLITPALLALVVFTQWGLAAMGTWTAGGPLPGPGAAVSGPNGWFLALLILAGTIGTFHGVRAAIATWRGRGSITADPTRLHILAFGRCPACLTPTFNLAEPPAALTAACPRCHAQWLLTDVPIRTHHP
jgi:hypothetical protein